MTKQSGNPDAGRALKPSNDTARIANSLALPSARVFSHRETGDATASGEQLLSAKVVEAAIREQTLRWTYVPAQLLADCAWPMLLELLHSEITERQVTPSVLCKAAGVSAAAGRRWIDALVRKGLCARGGDGGDSDTVELSTQGSQAMRGYFAELLMRRE